MVLYGLRTKKIIFSRLSHSELSERIEDEIHISFEDFNDALAFA